MDTTDKIIYKMALDEAQYYYANVIGEPRPGDEDYENFLEGYAEGFMRGRWSKEREING